MSGLQQNLQKKWFLDEQPAHTVKLDGFHIDIYEITQEEFDRVMGKTPSEYKGSNRPVDNVTWFEAREYCKQLGKLLPTEAEWERAARGKNNFIFSNYFSKIVWGRSAEKNS